MKCFAPSAQAQGWESVLDHRDPWLLSPEVATGRGNSTSMGRGKAKTLPGRRQEHVLTKQILGPSANL